MASGRRSAGERVLEGRHVIGLFFLMLLFSGVFFTLGYVMGRNQFEGQVRAEGAASPADMVVKAKPDVEPKRTKDTPQLEPATDPATTPNSDWEFYHAGESKAADDHLQPVPAKNNSTKPAATTAKNLSPATKPVAPANAKNIATPQPALHASFTVQVAALTKQGDAIAVAQSLQKKKFPAYVIPPQGDKYYRVQVGPYPNQKAADAARKSIESAGFKAIVKHG